MIQTSRVSFYSPDKDQTIEITFELNTETNNLDYHTTITPEMSPNDEVDLNFFLADSFMNGLVNSFNSPDNTEDNEGSNTSTEA